MYLDDIIKVGWLTKVLSIYKQSETRESGVVLGVLQDVVALYRYLQHYGPS